jgi:hypothetical protein
MVRGFALLCIRQYAEWWSGLLVFNQHKSDVVIYQYRIELALHLYVAWVRVGNKLVVANGGAPFESAAL